MKQKMVLAISLLIGVLAFWLTRQYFNAQKEAIARDRERILAGVRMVKVIAAFRDLPAGTILQRKDLAEKTTFDRELTDKTILPKDADRILGRKLKFAVQKEETLLWTVVDVPYYPGSGLAPMVNPGLRAVSISVGGAAAVSGLVQPNDRVDILGTFFFPSKKVSGEMEAVTLTVLQDVTVLACGQTLAKQEDFGPQRRSSAAGYATVTLEVTPREAELLVFAETMKGRLTLSLRNPADISYEKDLPEIDFEHVEKKLPELNLIRQISIRHKTKL